LLVTHKQLLDMEGVRVRRAGGSLVHHEKTAAVPEKLAEKFGRERGRAGADLQESLLDLSPK
jgi:hypothetical protein